MVSIRPRWQRFGKPDVTRLLDNPGIIRSRAKIEATIAGARIYEEMRRNGEDFSQFVWKLAGGKPIKNKTGQVPAKTALSEEISAALKKRGFKFVGPVIVYAWMQASGIVNDHALRCFRRNLRASKSDVPFSSKNRRAPSLARFADVGDRSPDGL